MNGIMFRMTLTTYWRGFRINKGWDEPYMYPEIYVSVILGFISFILILRNSDQELYR